MQDRFITHRNFPIQAGGFQCQSPTRSLARRMAGIFLLTLCLYAIVSVSYALAEETAPPKKKGGFMVSMLALGVKFTPSPIAAPIAQGLKPETTAAVSEKISVKKAQAIAKRMKYEYLSKVTKHLDPVKASAIIEGLPTELVTQVLKMLLNQGEASVAQRIADQLPSSKLAEFANTLSPEELLRVGRDMENKTAITEVIHQLPDMKVLTVMQKGLKTGYTDFLVEVIQRMIARGNEKVVAKRLGQLSADEKSMVIRGLSPNELNAIGEQHQ